MSLVAENLGITNEKTVILQDPHGGESFALLLNTESGLQEAIPTLRLNSSDWADVVDNARRSLNITPSKTRQPPPRTMMPTHDDDEKSVNPISLMLSTPKKRPQRQTWDHDSIPPDNDNNAWVLLQPYFTTSDRDLIETALIEEYNRLASILSTAGRVTHSDHGPGILLVVYDDNGVWDAGYAFQSDVVDFMHVDDIAGTTTGRLSVDARSRHWPIPADDWQRGMHVVFNPRYDVPDGLRAIYVVLGFDIRRGLAIIGTTDGTYDRLSVPMYALTKAPSGTISLSGSGGTKGGDPDDLDWDDLHPPDDFNPDLPSEPSRLSSPKKSTKTRDTDTDDSKSSRMVSVVQIDQLSTTNYVKASKSFKDNVQFAAALTDFSDWLETNRVVSLKGKPFVLVGINFIDKSLVGYINYDYSKLIYVKGFSIDAIRKHQFVAIQKKGDVHTLGENLNPFFKGLPKKPLMYEPVRLGPHKDWFVYEGSYSKAFRFGIFSIMTNRGEVPGDDASRLWMINMGAITLKLRNYGTEDWLAFRHHIKKVNTHKGGL